MDQEILGIAEGPLPCQRPDREDVFVGLILNTVLFVQVMSACGSIDLQDDRLLFPEPGIKVARVWKEGVEDERTPPRAYPPAPLVRLGGLI